MTEEQQETIVNEVLRKFVRYVNSWWDDEPMNKDEKSPYTVETFTTMNPTANLYGETHWVVHTDRLVTIIASDGDEGGPSTLIVGMDEVFPENISWIVHIFDTMPYMMWTAEDGFRSPPNGDFKKED